MDLAFSDKSASTQQVDNSNNIYTTTTEMISLLEEGEISSMDEVFFNHNDINNPTEIKCFDLGINTVNNNSYKSTKKISVEKLLILIWELTPLIKKTKEKFL
ncbi:1746_t:CDS:2 [Entrophospora sp. SA101]|nr:1746_t:CDS:2 [Entrophospora sp. SA101]